jgi:hypothetical protein
VLARGSKPDKRLTAQDLRRLAEAEALCRDLLLRFGVDPVDIFLGTLNAGHPAGGSPGAGALGAEAFPSPLMKYLYVCIAAPLEISSPA